MNTLFLSDLHLNPDHPNVANIFFALLKREAKQADAIYILGDLFETWIGDDDDSEFNQNITQALKTVTQHGIPIYIMHGNRDLLIGKRFLEASGCRLLKDPTCIDLYGVPTLLMHGDTLCTDDVAYLKFRKKIHHPFVRKIFLMLPLSLRKKIADELRQQSQKHTQQKTFNIMDANVVEIRRVMQQHHVELLIHGHTHRPSIEYFSLENKLVSRIVLSDWHDNGNILICSANGERRLITIY